MEESFAIPAAISYRQLETLAENAPADRSPIATSVNEPAALDSALEAWCRASQQLLQTLQQAGPSVSEDRSPRQLMALGALQAHVAMGLQALASSRRPQD